MRSCDACSRGSYQISARRRSPTRTQTARGRRRTQPRCPSAGRRPARPKQRLPTLVPANVASSTVTVQAADVLLQTLRVRGELDAGELRRRWAAVSVAGLAELVEYEGCALWLYRRLKELRLLDAAPLDFVNWLVAGARYLAAHNLRVYAQCDVIVKLLNSYGVPHVLLKGAARRQAADVYPYADARATGDVDVLLPQDLARPTWERLRAAGFEVANAAPWYDSHFHLPPLWNDWGVKVELHTSTALELLPAEAWRRMSDAARVIQRAAGETRIPAATELFWHALTHAAEARTDGFRIRFLQDAAVVWASGEEIDWGEIAGRLDSGELRDAAVARRWLGAAAWLSGIDTPDERMGELPAFDLCHLLRWRLLVFRVVGGVWANRPVWGRDPVSRSRRLLIEEGTRSALDLPLTPPPAGATRLTQAGRYLAAGAARLCYQSWQMISPA